MKNKAAQQQEEETSKKKLKMMEQIADESIQEILKARVLLNVQSEEIEHLVFTIEASESVA
jgi:signal transduction histidine kinase